MYIVDGMFLLAFVCMNRHSLIKLAITCNNFRDYLIVTMSSLVVMLPKGHRVKVATNPNMALLAIKVNFGQHL